MNLDRESAVLKAECSLALARAIEADPVVNDPFALACSMFFAGVDAVVNPTRPLAEVECELFMVRERIQRVSPPNPRRRPNFGGISDAQHRSGTDTSTPARRASDQASAQLAADLEAEARRARSRDQQRWEAAHQPAAAEGMKP